MIPNSFQTMLAYQAQFQAKELQRIFPEGFDKTALHHSLCSHLISEAQELMDCVPWMLHKPIGRGDSTRKATVTEMIDVFKWLLNLMILHEVSFNEFNLEFCEKSTVVESRIKASQFARKEKGPILVLDMDGVLCDRDTKLLQFVNKCSGFKFDTIKAAKAYLGQKDYEGFKFRFYEEIGFGTCEEISEVTSLLKKIIGVPILVLTARDVKRHPGLHFKTIQWLHDSGIQYDALVCMSEKEKALASWCHPGSCFVDDDPTNIERVSLVCTAKLFEGPQTVMDAIQHVQKARDAWRIENAS
jgi:hypothetical protein